MSNSISALQVQVEQAKLQMVELAEKRGRDHPGVLRLSRKIDRMVLEIQKRKLAG